MLRKPFMLLSLRSAKGELVTHARSPAQPKRSIIWVTGICDSRYSSAVANRVAFYGILYGKTGKT